MKSCYQNFRPRRDICARLQDLNRDLEILHRVAQEISAVGCKFLSQYRKLLQDASFVPWAKVYIEEGHTELSSLTCPPLHEERDYKIHNLLSGLSSQSYSNAVEMDCNILELVKHLKKERAELLGDRQKGVLIDKTEWTRIVQSAGPLTNKEGMGVGMRDPVTGAGSRRKSVEKDHHVWIGWIHAHRDG
eukprot:763117-Hanusia_phi.AAC.6